ncbi:MAG TPA: hypothetical protein PLH97_12890 [Verrucomicrobiota bacterium]|nr:hypothetical protein [Verrucomicrobiota bacterium]HPU57151.1 hypothetical protein [Verrucomicrobiota bacterium]
MNRSVERLVAALREELTEYGEMLVLLDQQQAAMNRQTRDLRQCGESIDAQFRAITQAVRRREEEQRQLAAQLGIENPTALPALLSRLPSEYQPLLDALFQENSRLLSRIQQRTASFKNPLS